MLLFVPARGAATETSNRNIKTGSGWNDRERDKDRQTNKQAASTASNTKKGNEGVKKIPLLLLAKSIIGYFNSTRSWLFASREVVRSYRSARLNLKVVSRSFQNNSQRHHVRRKGTYRGIAILRGRRRRSDGGCCCCGHSHRRHDE